MKRMKTSTTQQVILVTLGIGIGILMNSLYKSYNVNRNTFFLGITIVFNTSADKDEFKTLFTPLAKFVKANEPDTLSYELCESDKDEKRIFLIERYTTKNAYLEIHRKSEPFLKFRGLFESMKQKYTMEGHSYIESNIGYV